MDEGDEREPMRIGELLKDPAAVRRMAEDIRRMRHIEGIFDRAVDAKKRDDIKVFFDAIREIYRLNEPWQREGEYRAYLADWPRIMSPIEWDCWYTIRCLGLRMYPQFPVGRYFVDFGDPWERRAIECDGAAFHKEPNRERDFNLANMGWEVLHIPGRRLVMDEGREDSGDAIIRKWYGVYKPLDGPEPY